MNAMPLGPKGAGAALLLLAAWLAGSAFAGGTPAATNADCDGAAWQRVIAAETERQRVPDARGIWRDGRSLVWPGRAAGGSVWLRGTHAKPAHGVELRADADGALHLPPALGAATLREALRGTLWLEHRDADDRPRARTGTQIGAALDALYGPAEQAGPLGATVQLDRGKPATRFALWAPTARSVALCLYERPQGGSSRLLPMQRDARTGLWMQQVRADLSGRSYTYLVDVTVRGHGLVRNRVTDPYSPSLTADSRRTWIADLNHAALAPPGWDEAAALHRRVHARAPHAVDMRIYELHVRDFSASDASVSRRHRGKYLAFTEASSDGMRHLAALSDAGITDVHLLPVFDIATIPEIGCVEPNIPEAVADSPAQQAAVAANTARDCFNWGYDPFHFGAPEGSYASDSMDGARRIVEFRAMVLALHRAGLRVGMDVVYNHTTASGQHERSVLDRVVPGYYQRYDAAGKVETSTCCDNTATERRMMGRLMVDTLLVWARDYRIDSFRFDLMGHQPRALMEQAQARLRRELGREIHFIGEGWNFGEVADNARFRQASQLELNGSGIGTFSDRMRDAARGGGHDDSAERLVTRQGWLNGLHLAPNEAAAPAGEASRQELLRGADLLRLGLAGTLRGVRFQNHDGAMRRGDEMRYGSQIAGYASQPGEVVNYVENHDNQTLWDINVLRLPRNTTPAERARVQMLGAALVAFSQGVAYFHAGMETLRSKSLDRNSYDSGDWFNRIDWRLQTNHFGSGLPPEGDNGKSWEVMRPFLADRGIAPGPAELSWARATFADLLRLRTSSSLFRLRSAEEVQRRLMLLNTGPAQNPALLVTSLDGRGLEGAGFSRIVTFINTHPQAQTLRLPELAGQPLVLHPVHLAITAGDRRPRDEARFDAANGQFVIPGRTALAYVLP